MKTITINMTKEEFFNKVQDELNSTTEELGLGENSIEVISKVMEVFRGFDFEEPNKFKLESSIEDALEEVLESEGDLTPEALTEEFFYLFGKVLDEAAVNLFLLLDKKPVKFMEP